MSKRMFKPSTIYLSVLANDHYTESLLEVVRVLQNKTTCFVTLNKPAFELEHSFRIHHVLPRNIFFVDTVTSGMGRKEDMKNVLYVSSPRAFTELSIAISEILRSGKFDCIVFDSLSTLSIYDAQGAEQLVSSLIQKTRAGRTLGVFTCLQGDMSNDLIQKSCMYVDEVVHFDDVHPILQQHASHVRTVVTVIGGIALLGIISSFYGLSSPTGAVFGVDALPLPSFVLSLLVLVGSIGIGVFGYYVHRKVQIQPRLVMASARVKKNAEQLRSKFRKRIQDWLKNHPYLF
ncbi:MAG TPA: hypothetical protein VJK72_00605 [Candidatus Nanoarchaeia archaeon]|nr:hypothetical protein [Candidatus Nanoarchaeia archaeon]